MQVQFKPFDSVIPIRLGYGRSRRWLGVIYVGTIVLMSDSISWRGSGAIFWRKRHFLPANVQKHNTLCDDFRSVCIAF